MTTDPGDDANEQKHIPVTVMVPVHNGASTLRETLDSLLEQDAPFDQLLIIDDNSTDQSADIAEEYTRKNIPARVKLIHHQTARGLARSYNEAAEIAGDGLLVTMHQDVLLRPHALAKLIEPFQNTRQTRNVSAATHVVDHPRDVWRRYNFWQKCLFSRLVGKKYRGLDGKFDCFRVAALRQVGMFDDRTFKTAGEDGDILLRLARGGDIQPTDAEIVHIHVNDGTFNLRKLIRKHAQYSNAQGALLRKHGWRGTRHFVHAFFRELLALGILVPGPNLICAPAAAVYAFAYTWEVYKSEIANLRILALPFVNILLLYVALWHSTAGFLRGRQTL